MRKKPWLLFFEIIIFSILMSCMSPDRDKAGEETYFFKATVLEIKGNLVLVEPLEGESILRSCDRISFGIDHLDKIAASVGNIVTIQYTGSIRETYPAQIDAISWSIL